MPALAPEAPSFRAAARARRKTSAFSGWTHVGAILSLGAAMTSLSLSLLRSPAWWEWAAVPAAFLIANLVEWAAHRGPMHHPSGRLSVMYEKHTLDHHAFFDHESMDVDSPQDFDMVLFSLPSLAVFLLGLGLPLSLLCFALVSWNAGWLFAALCVDYYVLYECFHLAYHLPASSAVRRIPGLDALRRHHLRHHDPRLMSRWNFNVTFPLCDRLFGTHWGARRAAP
jgi:sterol desaturase/sphingolipid hydroxylase (fatty acid hydroxylase superfamily)